MTIELKVSPDGLALVESLRDALVTANSLGGYHERQIGGSYGAIKTAMIVTLACEIGKWQLLNFTAARAIATRIYEETVDCGESVEWCIELWREGLIDVDN